MLNGGWGREWVWKRGSKRRRDRDNVGEENCVRTVDKEIEKQETMLLFVYLFYFISKGGV